MKSKIILTVSVLIFASTACFAAGNKVSVAQQKTPVIAPEVLEIRECNKIGDKDKVIALANRYLVTDPKNIEVLTLLGENYGWKKEYALAEKSFKKALEIEPQNIWPLRSLACVYRMEAEEKTGKERDKFSTIALNEITSALKASADDPWVNREAAQIYLLRGDRARALQAINKTLKIIPDEEGAKNIKKTIEAKPKK